MTRAAIARARVETGLARQRLRPHVFEMANHAGDEDTYYEAELRADARRRWILIVAVPVAAVAAVLAMPLVLGGVAGRGAYGTWPLLPAAVILGGAFSVHAGLEWRSRRRRVNAMPRARVLR